MKFQDIGLLAMVGTICIAFLGSVLGSAIGFSVSPELQGVINTAFIALAAILPTWLTAKNAERGKSDARSEGQSEGFQLGVQSKTREYETAMLRAQSLRGDATITNEPPQNLRLDVDAWPRKDWTKPSPKMGFWAATPKADE